MRRPGHLATLLLVVFVCALAYAVVSAWTRPVSLPRDTAGKDKPGPAAVKAASPQATPARAPSPPPRPLFRPDRVPFREGNGASTAPKKDYAAEAAKYVLIGVTVLPDGAKALIRKEPKERFEVGEGDALDFFRVVEVTEGGVTLSADNQTVSLKMRAPAPADKPAQASAPKDRPAPMPAPPPGVLPPPPPPSAVPYPTPPARRM